MKKMNETKDLQASEQTDNVASKMSKKKVEKKKGKSK